MTSIQPELWVETPGEAVAFYEAAFGATVLHRVGEGDDVVAQLGVGGAAFWVAATSAVMKRRTQSMGRPAERCSWSKTPSGSSGRRSARRNRPGEQRARLAARPDHRPIWPRVGDRRASGSLAAELSGA